MQHYNVSIQIENQLAKGWISLMLYMYFLNFISSDYLEPNPTTESVIFISANLHISDQVTPVTCQNLLTFYSIPNWQKVIGSYPLFQMWKS